MGPLDGHGEGFAVRPSEGRRVDVERDMDGVQLRDTFTAVRGDLDPELRAAPARRVTSYSAVTAEQPATTTCGSQGCV
jgi:hypothetical protein